MLEKDEKKKKPATANLKKEKKSEKNGCEMDK